MRCHYEVLGIKQDAEDHEIKIAYKKQALKWHPDKNLDNPAEAKVQFLYVQQAYEILSDRQERAWYDNHREQILRGADKDYEDNNLDVFQYFTTSCYKGYGDDEESFYSVYRKIFEDLAKEDMDFMEDKDELSDIPTFGSATSDYKSVVEPFYNHWLSYSTKKSYVWLDPYNIREKMPRKRLRILEKENEKVRRAAKKERNEEIRQLVKFVRKRDKRVQAHLAAMEVKAEQQKQKIEKQNMLRLLKQNKNLQDSHQQQSEWMKFDNVKSGLDDIERAMAEEFGETVSSEDEDFDNLYCIACKKLFKTPKTFQNHELSKKHRNNKAALKEVLFEEEEQLKSYEDDEEIEDDLLSENEQKLEVDDDEEIVNSEDSEIEEIDLKKEEKNDITETEVDIKQNDECNSKSEESENEKIKTKKKQKKMLHFEDEQEETVETPQLYSDCTDDNHFEEDDKKPKKGKKAKKKVTAEVKKSNSTINGIPKVIKNSKKKRDKAMKKIVVNDELPDVTTHNCAVCKSQFPSKNKLFDHLKNFGHSVYIPKEQNGESSKFKRQ